MVDVEVELVVLTFTLGKMSNFVLSIEEVEASYTNLQHLTIFTQNLSTATTWESKMLEIFGH